MVANVSICRDQEKKHYSVNTAALTEFKTWESDANRKIKRSASRSNT